MEHDKKVENLVRVEHTFLPIYDKESKVLVLGTFPSIKSRENQFYYGHPQNRFWKVIAAITESTPPITIEEKRNLLKEHHIAVWDVIKSCSIIGSSDSSIRDVVVNDFSELFQTADIKAVYANGGKAYELYMKYAYTKTGKEIKKLPSTSPANAKYQMEQLCQEWKQIIA